MSGWERAVPEDVRWIFNRRGEAWTAAERERVEEWLAEPLQYQRLLRTAAGCLRSSMPGVADQAEDALIDFWVARLPQAVDTYDPDRCGANFCGWLVLHLKQHVSRFGSRALRVVGREGDPIEVELEADDSGQDPSRRLEDEEFARLLQQCLNRLAARRREAFILRAIEEADSFEQVARAMSQRFGEAFTVGAVRRLYHWARRGLQDCLEEGGWTP